MNILLADHQPRVRFALRILLEQQPGWSVVGEAKDAAEMLQIAADCRPDLVILDGGLPGLSCVQHLPGLRSLAPSVCIVALNDLPCANPDRPQNGTRTAANGIAKPAGASTKPDAYASKSNSPEHLLAVLRSCVELRHTNASIHQTRSP